MHVRVLMAKVCFFALSFVVMPGSYAGEPSPVYATVGQWQIHADMTIAGCFAVVTYEQGTTLRLGLQNDGSSIRPYVMLGNPEWTSIEYGKTYQLELSFGNESPWTGDAEGFSFDPPEDQSYILMLASSEAIELFFDEFMRERSVAAKYNDNWVLHGKLDGSYQAGLKIIECQTDLLDALGSDPFKQTKGNDPFRDTSRTNSRNDPFAH